MTEQQQKSMQTFGAECQKISDASVNYMQDRRSEVIKQCYDKNKTNPSKFSKCADQAMTKSQKSFNELQFMIMFAKYDLASCLLAKKMDVVKCGENPGKVLTDAKTQFSKDMKSL